MAGGELMIYDSKGNGYTEEQIARLVHLLNDEGAVNPGFWGRVAGRLVGKNIALKDELERTKRELSRIKHAALDVLTARDKDDDPSGHPAHCHSVAGHWDRDGSKCDDCAAYDALAVLIGKG